ncbi:glyxoylase [filamentous cyanobacterium CCP1]|jgi:PhnB protein|nr:glyxoylase [filamentous cyanobacterium CCP2]PSB60468.1 glyxoylase [filamentous cyanobacterium CCP1]
MVDAVTTSSKGYHTVTPHLTVRGAEQAIEFYKNAFGAEELYRMPDPTGKGLWHVEIKIGDSYIFLNDEYPDVGSMSPNTLGGSSVTLHLDVEDVDAWFERAVRAGATVTMPVEDMFWGDRYGKLVDPFGHHWSIASPLPKPKTNGVEEATCA